MKFVSMLPMLRQAVSEGYAVPSFCVWNAESMLVVLRAAARLKAPVILMNGEAEFGLLSPRDMATVARAVAERFNVTAALHLDHGSSPAVAEECLAAGYTSVMLDYSSRPFAENLETLRRLTALARPCGVTVEGELGVIGRADAATVEGEGSVSLTDPQMAAEFVERTGIDALAVSIGNAHGLYTKLPQLDFARLAELQAAARVPLVLHGGSGTPEADLRRAISLGIAKVNVASEYVAAVRQSLLEQWSAGKNLWTPMAQAAAMQVMAPIIEKWFLMTGAAGKA